MSNRADRPNAPLTFGRRHFDPTWNVAALTGIGLAYLAPVLAALSVNIALGYDEAVYAQLSRHWIAGTDASGWGIHRPPGLSLIGLIPLYLTSGAEWALRFTGVVAGALAVLTAWWFARFVGGWVAGLIAAVTLATASPLQVESTTFLTDVPSTFLLLLMTALMWRHLSDARPIDSSFVWLALLAAAAFYLRYGALVAIGGLAIGAAVGAPRKLLGEWRIVVGTTATFGILLLPHVAISVMQTGAPGGIVASAQGAARGADSLPLISYLGWYPWQLIGPLGAAVSSFGVIGAIRGFLDARRGRGKRRSAFAIFIGVAVLSQVVILGTLVHAEPRYVLFVMTLLIVAGAVQIGSYLNDHAPRRWLAPAAVLASAAVVIGGVSTVAEIQARAITWDWKRDIGRQIHEEVSNSASGTCSVLTADVPIISWYSRCPAVNYLSGPSQDRLELLTGTHRYVVVREDGHLQPPMPILERSITARAELWRIFMDGHDDVVAAVYRIP